jgi:hypothetical protein
MEGGAWRRGESVPAPEAPIIPLYLMHRIKSLAAESGTAWADKKFLRGEMILLRDLKEIAFESPEGCGL